MSILFYTILVAFVNELQVLSPKTIAGDSLAIVSPTCTNVTDMHLNHPQPGHPPPAPPGVVGLRATRRGRRTTRRKRAPTKSSPDPISSLHPSPADHPCDRGTPDAPALPSHSKCTNKDCASSSSPMERFRSPLFASFRPGAAKIALPTSRPPPSVPSPPEMPPEGSRLHLLSPPSLFFIQYHGTVHQPALVWRGGSPGAPDGRTQWMLRWIPRPADFCT